MIEKALEVKPDDRYQTADEFKAALLAANNAARRREGDYIVTPPPGEEKPLPADSALLPPDAQLRLARPGEKSPSLLPISTPI